MNQSIKYRKQDPQFSQSVLQRLNWYAVAAGAAGVSLLALAQPAEAEIVFTSTHVRFTPNATVYDLDLNNDGVPDFQLLDNNNGTFYDHMTVKPLDSIGGGHLNAVVANSPRAFSLDALALNRGSQIGNSKHFVSCKGCSSYGADLARVEGSKDLGYWPNVTNRYLGLRLVINGEIHFGWARLSVQVDGQSIVGVLSGYAYESTPNQPILAGKTSGAEGDSAVSRSPATAPGAEGSVSGRASLGVLALGAQGIPFWRREEAQQVD